MSGKKWQTSKVKLHYRWKAKAKPSKSKVMFSKIESLEMDTDVTISTSIVHTIVSLDGVRLKST